MENQSIIVNEDLSSIIDRAQVTQNYYDNKKAKERLKRAESEAREAEAYIGDIYVLNQVLDKMLYLESVSTANKNGVFSKKQTSKQFIRDIKEQIQGKKDGLVTNLKKELDGLPLMKKKYYHMVSGASSYFANHRIVDDYRRGWRAGKVEDYDKEARDIICMTTTRMVTDGKMVESNVVRVSDGIEYTIDGEKQTKYIKLNLVDAGLHNCQKAKKERLETEVSQLTREEYSEKHENIDEEYEATLNYTISQHQYKLTDFRHQYPNIDASSLESIINKIVDLETKRSATSKSITMYERFVEFISNNLSAYSNNYKYQIIDKLKKEIRELKQNHSKLISEISKLEKEFELTQKEMIEKNQKFEEKMESIAEKGKENNHKVNTSKPENNTSKLENNTSKHQKDIEELEVFKSQLKELQVQKQQKDMYEKYKEVRDVLDDLFSRKNQFSNEEYFRQEVVKTLYQYGSTYEEIIKNIRDMREQLDVTKIIRQAIDQLRFEYDDIEEMNREDNNGLTNFENRIVGRLITIQMSEGISDELRSEINYYSRRQRALESEMKFAVQNKNSYSKEDYQQIIEDLKIKYYLNTNILEEVGLGSKVYRR